MNQKSPSSYIKNAFFCLLASLVLSCEPDASEPIDSYNYYPLEVGRYAIYQVNEEVYSTGQDAPVINTWQERDEVARLSTSPDGMPLYTIARSTRKTATDYWQKVKEFTVEQYPDKLLTNLDNQIYFSLAFPATSQVVWNGNSYNNLDKQDYHYEDLGVPAQIGDQSFERALTVVERNDTSIINRYMGVKKYGYGVGLISDDQTSYEYCQTESCIGSGKIESGTHRVRRIISYGSR